MSQVPNANSASGGNNAFGAASALNEVDLDDFMKLMITELQNQDPLNPLENDELIAQISQIREVGATEQLTETLNAVLLGQNIASATSLIGADVDALTDEGDRVTGNVRVVNITDGKPSLDLAVGPSATAAEEEGNIAEGKYVYEVVWADSEGTLFGTEIDAIADAEKDFNGSFQLRNLPVTDGEKLIFRTDHTGEGDRKLVGALSRGDATTFTDVTADEDRTGNPITAQVQNVDYARKVTVGLRNIGSIRPPASNK